MAARLRSRLSLAYREATREQETEPGTPVTGQIPVTTMAHGPSVENPPVFHLLGVGRGAIGTHLCSGLRFAGREGVRGKRAIAAAPAIARANTATKARS